MALAVVDSHVSQKRRDMGHPHPTVVGHPQLWGQPAPGYSGLLLFVPAFTKLTIPRGGAAGPRSERVQE